MRLLVSIFLLSLMISCGEKNKQGTKEDGQSALSDISTKDFREFKVLDSKYISKDSIWKPFEEALSAFSEAEYNRLKPLILEKDINALQRNISKGSLSYETLTAFYLYRIRKFDRENELSLNSVISINPNCLMEAKICDENLKNNKDKHPIFGMPILLKDNINTSSMPTTAGAVALQDNIASDAFIVGQLKQKGTIILGKANLSEWAYFFCSDCPSGYSAIGGQTLNPYGRRVFDTGGSSSGSGVAVAANFCVAAVGSETSGSILSPSSQNSLVGLKPTIGLLSRSGIVPISSTLDTPGPMTRTVRDNAIVLDGMTGFDSKDDKSIRLTIAEDYFAGLDENVLEGKRFGVFKRLMEDSLYSVAVDELKFKGAEVQILDEEDTGLPNFIRLLNLDMKKDLPHYFAALPESNFHSVSDVVAFNKQDAVNRMPYGQKLFEGIVADDATEKEFQAIKDTLFVNGKLFFDKPMQMHNLDGIVSINNYHAGFAAVAEYPAITVPMGYTNKGEPKGLTFISKPLSEKQLLNWAFAYEQASKHRKMPSDYK